MKNLLLNLGVNLVSLACVVIAGYLALQGKNGWGWFLFGGIISHGSYYYTK